MAGPGDYLQRNSSPQSVASSAGTYQPAGAGGGGGGNDPTGAFGSFESQAFPDSGSGNIQIGSTGGLLGGSFLQGLNAGGQPVSTGISSTTDELVRGLYSKSPAEVRALQQQLKDAGVNLTVSGIVDAPTLSGYSGILRIAELYQSANPDHPITPDQLLSSLAQAGSGQKSLAKTINETSTSTNITDPVKARQTLVQAMADKLGRKPTDQEVATFTQSLNAYEQANPTVTNTTLSTDDTGTEKSRTSTTTGKATDPGAQALQYIQDQHGPEQKAVNHLSWYQVALNALQGSGVSTGLST